MRISDWSSDVCSSDLLTTLNHAFDANSLNGLASKIVKGRYPPVDPKYSTHLRDLIAAMLMTNPAQRPDMDDVLSRHFIRKHIYNFMSDIVSRPASNISDGTMAVGAAAVNAEIGQGSCRQRGGPYVYL